MELKDLGIGLVHFCLRLIGRGGGYAPTEKAAALAQAGQVADTLRNWSGGRGAELISLGENCSISQYIKHTGHKRASYPFDWLATSPKAVAHILADDFKTLLDRSQMVSLGTDAGSLHYHGSMYGHRNPARSDADYQYYVRCVERWRQTMQAQQPVVLIMLFLNEHNKRKRVSLRFTDEYKLPIHHALDDVQGLMDIVVAQNPKVRFVFFEQYTDVPFALSVKHQTDRLVWIKFASQGSSTGLEYLSKVDDAIMRELIKALGSGA